MMPKVKMEVTLSAEEINTILRKELNLTEDYKINWSLKSLTHDKYDDFRDAPSQTVASVTFSK